MSGARRIDSQSTDRTRTTGKGKERTKEKKRKKDSEHAKERKGQGEREQQQHSKRTEVERRKIQTRNASARRTPPICPSVVRRAAGRISSNSPYCMFSLCCLCAAASAPCILSTKSAAGGRGASASGDSSGLLSACVDSDDGIDPLIGVCSTDDEA